MRRACWLATLLQNYPAFDALPTGYNAGAGADDVRSVLASSVSQRGLVADPSKLFVSAVGPSRRFGAAQRYVRSRGEADVVRTLPNRRVDPRRTLSLGRQLSD